MITKLVRRYYCEHCRKGGMTRAMARHEVTCVRNPERVCRMCQDYSLEQVPLVRLLEAAAEGLGELRETTQCPACVLAAWIQFHKQNPPDPEEFEYYAYKAGMKEFLEDLTPTFHQ